MNDALRSVALGRQEMLVVLPPGTPITSSTRALPAEELASRPIVTTPRGTSTRQLLDEAFAAARVTPQIAVVTAQREAVLPLVLAGAGASLLPQPVAANAASLGAVVVPMRPRVTRGVVAVHRASALVPGGRGVPHDRRGATQRSVGDRKACVAPRLEPADEVGGVAQAEVLQARGRETRRVALGTHEDHHDVVVGCLGHARARRRIEAPLQHVALDEQCTRDRALALPLFDRTGVDEQRAVLDGLGRALGRDALESRACRFEQVVDRGHQPSHWSGRGSATSVRNRRNVESDSVS